MITSCPPISYVTWVFVAHARDVMPCTRHVAWRRLTEGGHEISSTSAGCVCVCGRGLRGKKSQLEGEAVRRRSRRDGARRMKWNCAGRTREGCTRGKTARVPLLARCHLHLEFFGHLSARSLMRAGIPSCDFAWRPRESIKETIITDCEGPFKMLSPLVSFLLRLLFLFFFLLVWLEEIWFHRGFGKFEVTEECRVWSYGIYAWIAKLIRGLVFRIGFGNNVC